MHGEDSFAEDSGMVCADGQLLSHITALPEVNCNIPSVRDRFALRVQGHLRAPMMSRFESIGKE